MQDRVLFIYSVAKRHDPLISQAWEMHLGLTLLMAILENEGYKVDLLVLGSLKPMTLNKRILKSKLSAFNPDFVCFTAVTTEYDFINKISDLVAKFSTKVIRIIGGVHASLNPINVMSDNFEYLIVGEGDEILPEFLDSFRSGTELKKISNLCYKVGNKIIQNPTRNYLNNLDTLPYIDKKYWSNYLEDDLNNIVLVGRGCPYSCNYCSNHILKNISSGTYVRVRSVESIIAEIESIILKSNDRYQIFFFLEIEAINLYAGKLDVLLAEIIKLQNRFKDKNIRWGTNYRIDSNFDYKRIFQRCSEAKLDYLNIGIEVGNDKIRNDVLDKNITNDEIIKQSLYIKSMNIKINTYNMLGLPHEDHFKHMETVALTKVIKPNNVFTSIFYPYLNTRICSLLENDDRVKFHRCKRDRDDVRVSYTYYPRYQVLFDRLTFDAKVYGDGKFNVEYGLFKSRFCRIKEINSRFVDKLSNLVLFPFFVFIRYFTKTFQYKNNPN